MDIDRAYIFALLSLNAVIVHGNQHGSGVSIHVAQSDTGQLIIAIFTCNGRRIFFKRRIAERSSTASTLVGATDIGLNDDPDVRQSVLAEISAKHLQQIDFVAAIAKYHHGAEQFHWACTRD